MREPHWIATEIKRLMFERGMNVAELARAAGVTSPSHIYGFFSGQSTSTLQIIERLLIPLDHELEIVSNGEPNAAIPCSYCHKVVVVVGGQCPRCNAILER